jgi:hypothetical protein
VNFVLSAIAPETIVAAVGKYSLRTNCAYLQRYQKKTNLSSMTEPIEVPYIKEYPIAQNATLPIQIH